jgi:hypothetical protein
MTGATSPLEIPGGRSATYVSCEVPRQSALEERPAVDAFEQRGLVTKYDTRAGKIAPALAAQCTVAPLHSLVYIAIYAGMSRTISVNLPELIS